MLAEAGENLLALAFFKLLQQFLERKVDHIVVVEFLGSDIVAQTEPETVKEVDFVGSEIGSVGAEDFVDFVASGEMDFEIELRFLIAEPLPGFADLAGLLFALPFTGSADDDGGGLKALRSAKDAVPKIVGGNDGETNGFAAFFGHGKSLGEKMLLDAAEKLVGVKFEFTGRSAAKDADVEDNDIAAAGLDAVKNITKMI